MLALHYQRLINRLSDSEREMIWDEWCNTIPIGIGLAKQPV